MAEGVLDLIDKCGASRETRRTRYGKLREWCIRGTESGTEPARYNKLRSHLSLLTSYLYAPESTRFYLSLPPDLQEEWAAPADKARDVILRRWRDSGADVQFGQLVFWALCYGATIVKILPSSDTDVSIQYCAPQDIGVLREDIPSLDRQDGFVHWYALSIPELERLTRTHPDQKKILDWARQQSAPGGTLQMPPMVQQILVSNVTGTFPNQTTMGATVLGQPGDERPEVKEPLVEIAEVWERVDFKTDKGSTFSDYLVSDVIGEWTIMERRNPILPHQPGLKGVEPQWDGEQPFIAIVPDPLLDYFWGVSNMLSLIPMQQWRETRMGQVDLMYKKQLDPPRFFSGVPLSDDKLRAMSNVGGFVSSPMPNAKMDVIQVPAPQDPFGLIHEIDFMFADAGGIPPVLGTQGSTARSGQQVQDQANIAVGRVRSQALVVEDALEVLASRMFHLLQRRDATMYRDARGKPFLLSQLPPETTVKVSSHSSSPVYREQLEGKADRMLKAGAIDLESYVELLDPPGMESLKGKARVLQEQKAKLAQRMLEIQEKKAERRGR